MFQPLPTPLEMAEWDRLAIEQYGLRGDMLMENASRQALNALILRHGPVCGKRVLCFAGSGNNGGDAFALARHLHNLGAEAIVLHTRPRKSYRGATAYHLGLCRSHKIEMRLLARTDPSALPTPDIVVDGLLGTGFEGALRDDYVRHVKTINTLGRQAFVLALDIPSGLSGLTGDPQPVSVRADLTTTFGAAKVGLATPRAQPLLGDLVVCEIAIPTQVMRRFPPTHYLLAESILRLVPKPDPFMHKGSAGHVLIVGGSDGLTGAPQLAAMGALRAGAGLVTIACPRGLVDTVKAGYPDVMAMGLGSGADWGFNCLNDLTKHLERFDAVVVGPGMGRSPGAFEFLTALTKSLPLPALFDADALFHLAADPDLIPARAVLTPHPGEMGRLLGTNARRVQDARMEAARLLAAKRKVVLALKGAGTVIADEQGNAYLSPFAEPNLAVAGSGDVLSGLVGTLLASGLSSLQSACLGVYWHGLAGQFLARDYPLRGNLASDIARALPQALKEHPCKSPKTS